MSSTILIFSDTHLTPLPDKHKLRFLMRIIEKADIVIINGDFWDSHLTTATQFTTAPYWQPLFSALKAKRTIYLYGNHDSEHVSQGFEDVFSVKHCASYDLTLSNQVFHIEHGNRIAPDKDETIPHIPRFLLGLGSLLDNALTLLGQKLFLWHYKVWNEKMKAWQKQNMDKNTYLICGHSHYAELSPQSHYANSGSIRGRLGSYILITDGVVELVSEKY